MAIVLRSPFNPNRDIFGRPLPRITGTASGGPQVNYDQNNQPIGQPPTDFLNLTRDPRLNRNLSYARDLYKSGRAEQSGQIDEAVEGLGQTGGSISDSIASRLQAIAEYLPLNPFSDELRGRLQTSAQEQIAKDTRTAKQTAGQLAARRGLSSGGSQASEAATNLDIGQIGANQDVVNELLKQQMTTNAQSNQFRAGLEAGLTVDEARILAGLAGDTARTQVAGAALSDPTYLSNLVGDATSAEIGREESDKLLQTIREATKNLEPTQAQKIFDVVSALLQGGGRDRLGLLTSAIGGTL